MERKEKIIGAVDVARAVVDLVVDEARLAFHAIFRMPHELASHGDHNFDKGNPYVPDWVIDARSRVVGQPDDVA